MPTTRTRSDAQQRDLAHRCERALFAAVRATAGGTRQQLRARARAFVRRHRRDASYLRWVLRCAAANSALAAALLLPAPSAEAATTLFTSRPPPPNLLIEPVFADAAPAFADLDADGNLDLVVGDRYGALVYYRGMGSFYVKFQPNPLPDPAPLPQPARYNPVPALGDLDGDGDLDLVIGELDGAFRYYENTGNAALPAFAERTGGANPVDLQDVGSFSSPSLGDLDHDGDLDLIAGSGSGDLLYYENTGSATVPAFTLRTGSANPLDGHDVGSDATPTLGDADRDGDLDLVVGEAYGSLLFFENTGSAVQPLFVSRAEDTNPFADHDPGYDGVPAFADLDRDGDLDLLVGNAYGEFACYENRLTELVARTGADNPLDGHDAGRNSAPAFGDLDGDADLDMIAGEEGGRFRYYENTGSEIDPIFVPRTGSANPFTGQDLGAYTVPALADLDADGDLDLAASSYLSVAYFQNTGSAASPAFVQITGAANPLADVALFAHAAPTFGDLDGDGDLDLVTGTLTGSLRTFENTGTASGPAFVLRTGAADPLDGLVVADRPKPALGDLDGDGDLDLVVAALFAPFRYFENTGSAASPAFVHRTGSADPLADETPITATATLADLDGDGDADFVTGRDDGSFVPYENAIVRPSPHYLGPHTVPFTGIDLGSFSSLAAGDLDGDGDPDFVAGNLLSALHYFENTGNALVPAVVERSGAANPFDGLDAGSAPRLALADIDTDGDLDLVAGEDGASALRFFENTGTATSAGFAARTGPANPFDAVIVNRAAPALVDLHHTGNLDLVVGDLDGTFHLYLNDGSALAPIFVESEGLDGLDVGGLATPAFGDIDGDGDLELMSGDQASGTFHYFERTASFGSSQFVERTGLANPLEGADVGEDSAPVLIDLDGNGSLELVSGSGDGTFPTYYLPEPASTSLFASGAGLLGWLARRRRRNRVRPG